MAKILLVSPPFLDISAPYPATGHLASYLRQCGHDVEQRDLGLRVFLQVFSSAGMTALTEACANERSGADESRGIVIDRFLAASGRYTTLVESVIRFLQGHDDALARAIITRRLLPEGPQFYPLAVQPAVTAWFNRQSERDRARYLATQFLLDVYDVIKCVAPEFGFLRYGERLMKSRHSFDALDAQLRSDRATFVDRLIAGETIAMISDVCPDVVGFSCPFPGSVYGALRSARDVKSHAPSITTVMGGGFVNTELRQLSDPRVFDFFDFVLYDDGERPFEVLLDHLAGGRAADRLLRARYRRNGVVIWEPGSDTDVPFRNLPAPDYRGLPFDSYLPLVAAGVGHQLSAARWNKLIAAHGCYWKRCTFCDTTLDYISRFAPDSAEQVVERMKTIHATTGWTGFHFVDEAAPPSLLKAIALRIRSEGLPFTWWGNIRFDSYFSPEVCRTLADGGCIAVSGGVEVASERILALIDKGVSLPQVSRVTNAFTQAGIFVHAYLMYGFPTQTTQETVDSLEVVRQLFAEGCLDSARWHRFVLTHHSPIGKRPGDFGLEPVSVPEPAHGWFAYNTIEFVDQTGTDHAALGNGLRRAVEAYAMGDSLDRPVSEWFSPQQLHTSMTATAVRDWIREP